MRRILNADGLRARTPRRTPPLTQKHEKSRLQFAQHYMNKAKRFRDSVLWSDETTLELFGPVDQQCVWRRETEAHAACSEAWQRLSDALLLFLRHWKPAACGDGFNHKTHGDNVISSVRKLKLWCHWIFQQDNDPKNTSESTKAWFQKRSWKILQYITVA